MMKLHLTPLGIIEEEDSRYTIKLFNKDPEEAGEIFYKLLKGDRETISEYLSGYKGLKIVATSIHLYNALKKLGIEVEYSKDKDLDAPSLLVKTNVTDSIEDARVLLNRVMTSFTTIKLKEEMTNKDLLIIHTINTYDEYTETINLFYERLREWYGVYFPELSDIVTKLDSYTNLVYNFLYRENYTVEELTKYGYNEDKARKIMSAAEASIGGLLSREDLEAIKMHAEELRGLLIKREKLENYLKELLEREAPNISALIGHKLAARLIAKAGGLRKLASYPASTIQLLGAEKSLFIALRRGGKPPKHGLIFQHPFINQSPRVIRGKVARLLASKIAIAARVDAFGGDFIGDKLYEEVKKRVEELRKEAPKIAEKKRKMRKRIFRKRRRRR